ncbi:acetyl-CoA carboxylase biotin carboxyl carrier protein [Bacillaceae bacterium W0354]
MLKVQEIRELIKLIDESSISDFTYESNGTKVNMKKNVGEVITVKREEVSQPVEQVSEKPTQTIEESNDKEETVTKVDPPKEESKPTNFDHEIVSPMVGTFYAAPSPEDAPYVQLGDQVDQNTVVCIVEAMKLFNEIEAEVKGEIVEILVENGELVEYGQPLFRVKKK